MKKIVYISIGNSDDKLTQAEWSAFYKDVNEAVRVFGHVHGAWLSAPDSRYQNAAWCVDVGFPDLEAALRRILGEFAHQYRQDSIAWAIAPETEFIKPVSRSER